MTAQRASRACARRALRGDCTPCPQNAPNPSPPRPSSQPPPHPCPPTAHHSAAPSPIRSAIASPPLSPPPQRFIQHGSYLLVERSKTIVYRNFFKRCAELYPEKSCKMDLTRIQRTLKAVGAHMDMDEVE